MGSARLARIRRADDQLLLRTRKRWAKWIERGQKQVSRKGYELSERKEKS
jgi:hypothetical protein